LEALAESLRLRSTGFKLTFISSHPLLIQLRGPLLIALSSSLLPDGAAVSLLFPILALPEAERHFGAVRPCELTLGSKSNPVELLI
jgi:hypothetical protein